MLRYGMKMFLIQGESHFIQPPPPPPSVVFLVPRLKSISISRSGGIGIEIDRIATGIESDVAIRPNRYRYLDIFSIKKMVEYRNFFRARSPTLNEALAIGVTPSIDISPLPLSISIFRLSLCRRGGTTAAQSRYG